MRTDDELIAEFMGLNRKMVTNVLGDLIPGFEVNEWGAECSIIELKYYSSWDWLMPVVEKIEETTTYVIEIWLSGGRGCRICYNNNGQVDNFHGESNSLIQAVYDAVIQFIKWYNSQKQSS